MVLATAINLDQPSYRRFRSILAERTRPVLLWCGAGLSSPAGLPSWAKLKEKLIIDLENKAFLFDEEVKRTLLKACENIEAEENPWVAFQRLRISLGETSFKESIREHLSIPKGAITPPQYIEFWKVGIRGVINLNLDRLATRAFSEHHNDSLSEISGNRISAAPNIVGSSKYFIINLHGILEDAQT